MLSIFPGAHPALAAALCVTLSSAAWCDTPREGTRYFFHGHLGNVAAVSDSSGAIGARIALEPLGEPHRLAGGGTANNFVRFTGKPLDMATGLYYFGARYYDPRTGRFLSPDPARQTRSPYGYAGGAPLANVDPDGRMYLFELMLQEAEKFTVSSSVEMQLDEVRAVKREMQHERDELHGGRYPLAGILGEVGAELYNRRARFRRFYDGANHDRAEHIERISRMERWLKTKDKESNIDNPIVETAYYKWSADEYRQALHYLPTLQSTVDNIQSYYLNAQQDFLQWKRHATPKQRLGLRVIREYQRQLDEGLRDAEKLEDFLVSCIAPQPACQLQR